MLFILFGDPRLIRLFYFIVTFLEVAVLSCQCLVFFCLLEHLFVCPHFHVCYCDLLLLHHVVLERFDLNAMLSAHQLDCVDVFLVFWLSCLRQLSCQGFDLLAKDSFWLFETLFQFLVIIGQFLCFVGVTLPDALQFLEGGLELHLECAVVAAFFLELTWLCNIYRVSLRVVYSYTASLVYS